MSEHRIEPIDFVLGELEPAERGVAERLLREDPAFRAEVERLQPVAGRLAELPPTAWEALPRDQDTRARPRDAAPRRWSLRPGLALAASLLLLVVGGALGALVLGEDTERPARGETVALAPVRDPGGEARGLGRISASAGEEALVEVSGLRPSGPGDYYELWLLTDPQRLVSLGSFRVPRSGAAEVRVPVPVDPQDFRFLDVSLERVDEGPEHSGISVLRGPLS